MSVLGLMEAQRTHFADALRVFKGGTTSIAEIQRVSNSGTGGKGRTWTASVPPEMVDVHWEAIDAEGADALGISLAGTHGRTFYFDGLLDTPLGVGDLVIVDDVKYQVEVISQPGNNSPIDSVAAVVRRG